MGLLDNIGSFSIVGDGALVDTVRFPRSKPSCDCYAQGITKCAHPRIYSQPDCNSRWDSSREKYFNGDHLYMLSTSDSFYDLPLYPKLNPASRHDAVSFVTSFIEFTQRFSLGIVDKMLLDAEAIYRLLVHQGVEPFIDLNPRTKKIFSSECDVQISSKGIPICSIGKEIEYRYILSIYWPGAAIFVSQSN